MKSAFTVEWAETARDDLSEIIDYIAADSAPDVLAVLDRIQRRADGLATAPERGRVVPELLWNGITTYRELVVPPWRVIYRIHETRVLVVSVVDSRRQLEDLLLARFLRS